MSTRAIFEKRLKNKSDEELNYIADNPDDMDADAVAAAREILALRQMHNMSVKRRHFGKEVLNELKSRKPGSTFRDYRNAYGYQTILAAVIPAVAVMALIHVAYSLEALQNDLQIVVVLLYIMGFPLGHFFYKLFHKLPNGIWGRLIQNIAFHTLLFSLYLLEISVVNTATTETSIQYQGMGSAFFLLLLPIPIIELGVSTVNALLKMFKIHLW